MFDIGFWELTVISLLALIVVGPERLPGVIRSVLTSFRSFKTWLTSTQNEMEHQLRVHELHENLKKAESIDIEKLSPEIKASMDELKQAAKSVQTPYQETNKDD